MKKMISLAALAAILAGCTNPQKADTAGYGSDGFGEETLTADSTAQSLNNAYLFAAAPRYYVGNAYKVDDVQYVPVEDLTYNQTGIAGIVPNELNGKQTSNGEIFDASQMAATSKTLPLPTIARVTNLENGQSVVVRVNNRGPFVNTRIMDLSQAAADRIGMTGNAKVQIQVLPDESLAVKKATIGEPVAAVSVEPAPQAVEVAPAPQPAPAPVATTGDYSVQVAAFYAEDSATTLAKRMRAYGDATVVHEGDMYKVRIENLDAAKARGVIDALRSSEGMAPGLLKNGRWVNADSI
jgi:rare lipoprotein A